MTTYLLTIILITKPMKKIALLAMSLTMALTMKAQGGTDVTDLLTNPDFENDAAGWTIVGGHKIAATAANFGYSGVKFIEDWTGAPGTLMDQSWSQTIEVPNGVYVVTSLAHAVQQSDAAVLPSGVSIYANNDEVAVTTTNTNPPTEYRLATVVSTGTLTVGYRIHSCNVNWTAWDNVRLYQYLGETEEEAKLAWITDELGMLATTAMELVEYAMQQTLADAIQTSVDAIDGIATYDAGAALFETLKGQVADAKHCIEVYKSLATVLEVANAELGRGFSEGVDAFTGAINTVQTAYDGGTLSADEAEAAMNQLKEDIFTFQMLNANGDEAFDVTERYMTNPTLRKGSQGWSGTQPGLEFEVMEFYRCDFNMYQTLTGIPDGMYVVRVQGCYRPDWNDGGAAYNEGTEKVTAELYANNVSVPLISMYKYSASSMGITSDKVLNDYLDMRVAVNEAFNLTNPELDMPYYAENALTVLVQGGTLTIGLRNEGHADGSWCVFRDFKLDYYGNFPAVVLALKIQEIEAWLNEHTTVLPISAYNELNDACLEAGDYTGIGDHDDDVVAGVINQLETVYASVGHVLIQVDQLKELLAKAEALFELEYPGIEALSEAYEAASQLVVDAAEVELPEGYTTEQYYEEAIATLQAAITAYCESQEATRDNPADYTHMIKYPCFVSDKTYAIPAPWVIANVMNWGDVWAGPCQPDAAGDGVTPLPGLNSWSADFTSMDVHQDIEGLPDGIYTVSAQAIIQGLGGQHAYAVSSLGSVVSPDMTIVGWDALQWETLKTTPVVVSDGKLRIGFASVSAGGTDGWFQVTNFKLQYYGKATDDDLKAAWETSLERANEYASVLLPGDAQHVKASIDAATPFAAAGKYIDACTMLNPVVAASDSIYAAVQKFYGGNYQIILDLCEAEGDDTNIYSTQLLTGVVQLVEHALHADNATHTILDPLNDKLGGYISYIDYLIYNVEATLATIKGVDPEHLTFVKDSVITPQVADLTTSLRTVADCAHLQSKLQKAMQALEGTLHITLSAGDITEDVIINPTIDDPDATGWTIIKGTGNGPTITGNHYDGNPGNRYLDSWNPGVGNLNFTAYQEIVGLPDGSYRLTVATRSDGDNVYVFASPEPLETDTVQWAAATQWAMVKKYYAEGGEIYAADTLLWHELEGVGEFPYMNANNGRGCGWSFDTIHVEVTQHYLAIGVTANSELTRKERFTGTWFGADDWKLELLTKASIQSEYNPFAGIEHAEAITPTIIVRESTIHSTTGAPVTVYSIDGKHVPATGLSRGIYVVRCEGIITKVFVR